MGATDDVATEGDYGWSPAYQDVLELRQKHDALLLARSGAIGSLCDDTHYYSARCCWRASLQGKPLVVRLKQKLQ